MGKLGREAVSWVSFKKAAKIDSDASAEQLRGRNSIKSSKTHTARLGSAMLKS